MSDDPAHLDALSDAIERLRIGHSSLFYNRLTRATVLSNEAGDHILDGLLRGRHPEDIAENAALAPEDAPELLPAIEQTLEAWLQAGLLSIDPISSRFPRASPARAQTYEATFRHKARTLRLLSEDAALLGQIATLLCDFRLHGAQTSADITLRIAGIEEEFAVFQDGRSLWRAATPDEARFIALQAIIAALTEGDAISAVLHAGLVVKDGTGLLLAGTTGRGKTTLTLALSDHGWSFGGDDLIALRSDGVATALPLGAHLKQTKDVLAREGARVVQWCDAEGGLYWPNKAVPSGARVPIRGILLPHYDPGHAPELKPVFPEHALETLLTTGTEPVGTKHTLSGVTQLLNTAPAYTMTYASTAQALELLAGLPNAP